MKLRRVLCVLGLFTFIVAGREDIVVNRGVVAGVSSVIYGNEISSGVSLAVKNSIKEVKVKGNSLGIVQLGEGAPVGYAVARVNIREKPSIESNILGEYEFNDFFRYSVVSDDWVEVLYGDTIGYVCRDYISDSEAGYSIVNIPWHEDFKAYMDYSSIKSWYQYKLQNIAYTGKYGMRVIDGRYCVAVGTACNAQIGDYGVLILENGEEIPIVVGDIKSDLDTGAESLLTGGKCCSEFIVEESQLSSEVRSKGNMSYACEEWQSPVVQIKVYDKNCLGL